MTRRDFGLRNADCGMRIREKGMTRSELEKRTKAFAIAVIDFIDKLPPNKAARVIGRQLLRSGTSIGANYREANRAQSRRDFIHKIAIIEKEAAESLYWIELLDEITGGSPGVKELVYECNQLVAIFTRIGKTAKQRLSPKSEIRIPHSEIPS
jgi:four helix bundle protein